LFARTMFLPPADLDHLVKVDGSAFTVVHVPEFLADPVSDKTRSGTFVLLHLGRRLVLVGGTAYAGEIKKSIFTIMNYLLPEVGVLPMHAAANMNRAGETAIFFGLSGTGKTTLSSDDERTLIGDDEHGWSADGVFNFEGGCYAKVIRLSKENEPLIYAATQKFGAIVENVRIDPETRHIDFDDETITENTRAAYPISTHVPNAIYPGTGGQPMDIVMLTADAFGVLPPIARLTPEQAMYYFILGYTAKVAGTEAGLTEPTATFSPCFGGPFMALHPGVYARMLGENIRTHNVRCWLMNTGWTGGPYGVGSRMDLPYTRRMLHAALNGELDSVPFVPDEIFGLRIPQNCRGVPSGVLNPAEAWHDNDAYIKGARSLAEAFHKQFAKFVGEAPCEATNGAPLWNRP
ncbi:MAG: phosphoenolpyruvate carboxykinase (ATP), partial [Nitrospirota bacterium]|nr:phosphoenolpyruvate carboxykinase (ATP) [Nitrospirota bacterium]